ncbi:MAG TPA: hypothetical protein VE908_00525 [Mycobacterium sp.]|jgi:hypothetical protein|nr:hypothetical protein [Mycobacterium sp.]
MLARFRRLMDFDLSIAELIGLGVFLAGPYLLIGLMWTCTHAHSVDGLRGVELLTSVLGSIALWPALLLASVCVG